jgi:hypothetical protein
MKIFRVLQSGKQEKIENYILQIDRLLKLKKPPGRWFFMDVKGVNFVKRGVT